MAFVFMVFVACLLWERRGCLLNRGTFSLSASFVVWLLPRKGIDGCLSSYGDHVGDKGSATVEENMIELNWKYVELGCKRFLLILFVQWR